ncbi:unnamed protein product [Adineta ricciae]|nr:unnamed protein product [Adineta ricciae]
MYVFQSTLELFQGISDKIILSIYSIVLLVSVIQTFWKNKHIDRFLAFMMEAYSDGKFGSSQIYYRQRIITCYRYDQRYSYIPNPNRSILLIFAIHIQTFLMIGIQTVFDRRKESINDCWSFHMPYEVLQCEDQRDPCGYNDTTGTSPKCTFYHFEMAHLITVVTSIVTWHYALRYFVVKLIRFARWAMFRDNDQPRKVCWCCCLATPRYLRFIMYFQYGFFWINILAVVLCGFILNVMIFRLSMNTFGSVWAPIIIAADGICSLFLTVGPELLQNWLNATMNGKVLLIIEQQELYLNKVEPLVSLIDEKVEVPKSSNTKCRGCCC